MKDGDIVQISPSDRAPLLVPITQVQNELKAIDECLHSLRKHHEENKIRVNIGEEGSRTGWMKESVSIILHKVRSIQHMLDDLDGDRTDPVLNGIRKSLKDRLNLLNNLRQNIRDEYREEVERYYYIVSGQHPQPQVVDEMIRSGESHSFLVLHQAIVVNHGQENSSMEDRFRDIKGIETDLEELQHIFMDLSILVWDQGEALDDIEKNMVYSGNAVEEGVVHLTAAAATDTNSSKWIWIWICGGLILLLILLILLILYSTRKSAMHVVLNVLML